MQKNNNQNNILNLQNSRLPIGSFIAMGGRSQVLTMNGSFSIGYAFKGFTDSIQGEDLGIEKNIKDQLQDCGFADSSNCQSKESVTSLEENTEDMIAGNWFYPYFAGFLDADGSIFCRIVERSDYMNLYQLSPGISLIQKTSRKHILLWFQKHIKKGVVRDRNDGISELNISGINDVVSVLSMVHKYLQLKRKQSNLLTRIIESLPSTKGSPLKFLELCILCDRLADLNDSKNRKITSEIVRARFLDFQLILE